MYGLYLPVTSSFTAFFYLILDSKKECESVVSPGIEPGSRASETLILSVVLRDQCANIVTACLYNVYVAV